MRKYFIVKSHWTLVGDVYSSFTSKSAADEYLSTHRQAEIWWEGTREEYIAKIEELKKSGIQVY